ncbi:hypothetical protein FHW69_001623 [Luteibacter sp. Sphag1AF]|uniref:hypothetical protein n=1 Tax=Luteibacter sp. Sphag1AF TaxID=2587031 RepID=UPI00161ACB54|nr:hypothetical protein [Luteibacter sp. Sphag1AF]MBB3227022.1 hypothetical protein [Luteibacter sp. Sphag1AF]
MLPATDRESDIRRLAAVLLAALPGKRVKVEVKEYRKDRSSPQCRYLNGVAYKILSDATGYERDDISEYLCIEYFGGKEKRVPGKRTVTVPLRTTTTDENGKRSVLTAREFADYVAFVQRFASKHGVFIPDPGEVS